MFLYDEVFLKLSDKNSHTSISRGLRILIAAVTVIIYTIAIFSLSYYALLAVEQGPVKRIIAILLDVVCLGYFMFLIKGIFKKSHPGQDKQR